MMADTSLSSVVSGLVRAQIGASVSSTVTDEDLDRHVAELILKEAKKKAEQYGQQGVSAYLPQPESNVPKPNKRFLSSIIRNTDDHNKSILRSQALSAAEIRIEREAQMRADRKARAQEAVAAERARRSVRGRDDSWDRERRRRDRSWERHGSDEGEVRWQPPKRRRRDDDEEGVERERSHGSHSARRSRRDEEGSSRRRRHRSRSPSDDEEEREKSRRRLRRTSRSRSKSPDAMTKPSSRSTTSKRHHSHTPDDEGHADHRTRDKRRSHRHDSSRRHRHRRSLSRTPDKASRSETLSEGLGAGNRPSGSRASSQPPPAEDRAGDLARRESELRRKLKGKGKASAEATYEGARSHSRTPILDTSMASHDASPRPPRSPSPGPRPPPGPPPPLPPPADFSRSVRPDLPSKMDKYFEASYDPRLDVAPLVAPSIPATGLLNNAEFEDWDAMLDLIKQRRADKAERKRLERLGLVEKGGKEKKKGKSKVAELGVAGTLAGWSEGGDGLMDIEYKKRGSVREWDLGKESPT
ncbi:hypothetical protein DFH94DRAFT_402786 [Russula ochroleuca]|uniref:Uncharacterized protein n=1 Tax=Russula ochroleuca TaxID=152965 RepID=A0A9P5TAH7_9AGAM|nr:hypothetical protein DFH94DRAFT_402786 [Russula ochroleuca]